MSIRVTEVEGRKALKNFINLPGEIHRDLQVPTIQGFDLDGDRPQRRFKALLRISRHAPQHVSTTRDCSISIRSFPHLLSIDEIAIYHYFKYIALSLFRQG